MNINTKVLRGTLALVAAGTFALTGCNDEPEVKNPEQDKAATQPAKPASEPGDVTTPEAKAELQAACDKISDDEAALILGVDTKATKWRLDEAMGEATEYNMTTGEYDPTDKPQCTWVVVADSDGEDRTLSVTLRGPADASATDGGSVEFPNGETGSYGSDDDATLYVSPTGSEYEYTFAADFTVYNELGEPTSNEFEQTEALRTATSQAAYEVVMN